jgi:prepilin-type N-terminal cleavage/methylation domain-containing protein
MGKRHELYRERRGGFTVPELLVAIALFSVLVSIAVGGYVVALRTQRQVVAVLAANANASAAIEQMAREMRTGYDFCDASRGTSCAGANEVVFRNADGTIVQYQYHLATEMAGYYYGAVERSAGGSPQVITGSNVNIVYLRFDRSGTDDYTDGYPPRITITMGVSPLEVGVSQNITNLQATISSRGDD